MGSKKTRIKKAIRNKKRLISSYLTNIDNKLIFNYRIQISRSKALGFPTMINLEENLNCELAELKTHLEKQFTSGMTWDNYTSKWDVNFIDPIINGGSLNFSNIEPQLK